MFAVAFGIAFKPFLGTRDERQGLATHIHEAPASILLGPAVLALVGLIAALESGFVHFYISSPMASAILHEPVVIGITTIPHPGLPLVLSLATIALGAAIFWRLAAVRELMATLFENLGPGPDRGFDHALTALLRFSVAVTRILQPGRLEIYITITFVLVAAMLLVPPIVFGELPAMPALPRGVLVQEWLFLGIAVIGIAAVLRAGDRLTAIVSLGIQGFAVAVIFLLFGAPDLSFTQFMVETLSVVILALVMTRLRLSPSDSRPLGQRLFDGALATACGLGFALLLLKTFEAPFDNLLTDFFNAYSKTIAHGANVVNVIIVDFRGTDTLGEIAVVTITGLAVLALIRVRAGGKTP
jgi:multicomponent Na+:H+ antiporter subunit A